MTNGRATYNVDGVTLFWEDKVANESSGLQINSDQLVFEKHTETPAVEEGEDPEVRDEEFVWCPDHIQLRDATTGETYQLSISNGQIVLSNLSL